MRYKNVRLGIMLVGVLVALSVGSVIFVIFGH